MMRLIERLVLLTVALFCLAAASCYASGEYTTTTYFTRRRSTATAGSTGTPSADACYERSLVSMMRV
jgi:hypothetical protein